ncbi:MAG: hypothetical protein E7075_03670 [Bacteroidales bacterium]|nr:hypothetical protein [Bacteroidales bacterium]
MRKKINLILGALIALLCGCKSQKDIPMQSDRIMVLYGPPAYFQQQTNQQQETQQQTTPQQEAPQEAPQESPQKD